MTDTSAFHKNAKDAGNRLSTCIMNISSGATAVLFFAATQESASRLARWPRVWLLASLVLCALTVALRLFELHVDARRFFELARQTGLDANSQDWTRNDYLRELRLKLIFGSYWTLAAALACVTGFMATRLF